MMKMLKIALGIWIFTPIVLALITLIVIASVIASIF